LAIDPFFGISGDMFSGLLVDLGLDLEKLKEKQNELQIRDPDIISHFFTVF
jgi:hypothetical protein